MAHKKCANCGHLPHDAGKCNTGGCECSDYAEVTGKPDGKPTEGAAAMPGRARSKFADPATPPPPPPATPVAPDGEDDTTTADPKDIVAQLDDALDGAQAAVEGMDLSSADPAVQSFAGLVVSASISCDVLVSALGATDSDGGDATAGDGVNTDALAEGVDATIVAARNLIEGVDAASFPDGLADVVAAIKSADEISGTLLDALGLYDPDEESGTDPTDNEDPGDDTDPNDNTDVQPGMANRRAIRAATNRVRQLAEGDGEPGAPGSGPDTTPAPEAESEAGVSFSMPIMVIEGTDTGDGRYINPEALTWRELPIPVMALTETGYGHDGAQLCGRIDTIERIDISAEINPKTGEPYGTTDDGDPVQALKGTGVFNSSELAEQVAADIAGGFLRGVSVDIGDVSSDIEMLDDDGNPIAEDEGDLLDILFIGGNFRETLTAGRVMGVTVCPFPAFEGAYIELEDGTTTPALQASVKPSQNHAINIVNTFGERSCEPCANGGAPLVASAGPMAPPKSWFTDPKLKTLTPLTITEDGRVFGHLAAWGTCHVGMSGRCVTPPTNDDFAHFNTGAVLTAEGELMDVGRITMDTGHAATSGVHIGFADALAHYDNTGTVAAQVRAGKDAHGIWVAGAMMPDVTDLQVRKLRGAVLSGDWRNVGGKLKLIAALAVNSGGYPVVRAHVASGAVTALVASGAQRVQRRSSPELVALLDRQTKLERELNAMRARELRARVHGR